MKFIFNVEKKKKKEKEGEIRSRPLKSHETSNQNSMTRDHETLLIRCFYTSIKLNMIIITAFATTQAFKTVVERERERERKTEIA